MFYLKSNILIVDDNDLNVELILQLAESYEKEKGSSINILTAINGQEAVDICNKEDVDIIFMDLMMPVMDGSEATKIIKKQHPKIMIIVVSALGDEAQQKEMLLNGAEDYIIKPLVASVFKKRLHNYIQLFQNRNHISSTPKARNLFTSKVYNYHMNFNIESEEHLAEFWEAMLIRLDFQHKIEYISDFVRFMFGLGTIQIQHKFKFTIIIEEDLNNFYFTVDNIKLIGCERVEGLINKHFNNAVYECNDNNLTFLLEKRSVETISIEPVTTAQITETVKVDVPETVTHVEKVERIQTYDIIDEEDLLNFEEYMIKINSIVLLMENSNLDNEEIEEMCNYLDLIASILSVPNDTYVIANSLNELTASISENMDYFNENSSMLFEFTRAFINDLSFWKTKIFYEGAPSVDFLNDSITTNANMLNALLKPEDSSDESIDDIFDF